MTGSMCRFCAGQGCLACQGTGTTAPQRFDGDTFDATLDGPRLTGAMERVRKVMADHQWHTLAEVAERAKCSEAGASARVRDLRKTKFGAYTVHRRRVAGGLWEYRMAR